MLRRLEDVTTIPIDAQIINGMDGKPAFAVIPYDTYKNLAAVSGYADHIPHEVVSRMVDGASVVKAWREYLELTQAEMADRMGISQAAYSQLESSTKLRYSSRVRIAAALGIQTAQLV
jgi:DNA-binding XRE family transcriptional regulator